MTKTLEILNANENAREMLEAGDKVIKAQARDKADAEKMREILVLMCFRACPEARAEMAKEVYNEINGR